jgi:hypothetical protein
MCGDVLLDSALVPVAEADLHQGLEVCARSGESSWWNIAISTH